MGNCSTGGCGAKKKDENEVGGCNNNGACGTSGCNRMNVFDWLSQMDLPSEYIFDVVEVKFKGGRKEFFRNAKKIPLHTGDFVLIDAGKGWHIGSVSLQGELVRLQMKKYKVKNNENLPEILRTADEKDFAKFEQAKNREIATLYRTREIIKDLGLQMKLSDIEYQADNTKATFFYSADSRVDFRELIKILASEFRIRVEMRQISIRQEAGRVGGIGACGRELCCSTWLSEFRSVSTSAARYQSLSLNPVKLSGQCGRLKCCLNYELETYLDALKDIPKIEDRILTTDGEARLQKTDIFRKLLWFSYDTENNWYGIPADEVVKMIEQNKKGVVLPPLSEEFWRKDYVPKVQEVKKDFEKNPHFDKNDPDFFAKKRSRRKKNPKVVREEQPEIPQKVEVKNANPVSPPQQQFRKTDTRTTDNRLKKEPEKPAQKLPEQNALVPAELPEKSEKNKKRRFFKKNSSKRHESPPNT